MLPLRNKHRLRISELHFIFELAKTEILDACAQTAHPNFELLGTPSNKKTINSKEAIRYQSECEYQSQSHATSSAPRPPCGRPATLASNNLATHRQQRQTNMCIVFINPTANEAIAISFCLRLDWSPIRRATTAQPYT